MKTLQLVLLFVLCVFLLAESQVSETSAPPTETKMETLYQQPFDSLFIKDREMIVSYTELPPNAALPNHWHPGEEFAYVLEGEIISEIGDMPAATFEAGSFAHIPFKAIHNAAAGENGAKVIVFRVHSIGEPERYLVNDSAEHKE